MVKGKRANYLGYKKMEKEYYTVEQARQAGFTLEPIKCSHCGHIGEVSYDQAVNDYYCAMCGKWDGE